MIETKELHEINNPLRKIRFQFDGTRYFIKKVILSSEI